MKAVKADDRIERLYRSLIKAMKRECDRDKTIRNVEIIATLGRAAGYCIAACYPNERDLARAMAIENMDRATKDVAQS